MGIDGRPSPKDPPTDIFTVAPVPPPPPLPHPLYFWLYTLTSQHVVVSNLTGHMLPQYKKPTALIPPRPSSFTHLTANTTLYLILSSKRQLIPSEHLTFSPLPSSHSPPAFLPRSSFSSLQHLLPPRRRFEPRRCCDPRSEALSGTVALRPSFAITLYPIPLYTPTALYVSDPTLFLYRPRQYGHSPPASSC